MSTPQRSVISDEEKQFFLDNGYLIVRSVLQGEELRRIQQAMQELTDYGAQTVRDDPDYMYQQWGGLYAPDTLPGIGERWALVDRAAAHQSLSIAMVPVTAMP